MAWDDEPPSKAELQQAPAEAQQESSWTDKPISPALTKLMQQGYLFDDYQKLDPEEKAFYDSQMQKDQQQTKAGLGLGLSKGAFAPVEIANKLIPGEREPNLRERAISGVERGLANTFGDDQTQELYNNIPQEELVARNVATDQEVQKNAPGAVMVGELTAGLPANIAVGGGAGAAAKAAQLGKVGTALTNIGTAGAVGEGYGIAHSDAPTLAGRAQEALPSAALAAGTAGLFEGASALASPEGQAATKALSNKLRGGAVNEAELSLNASPAQLLKMQSAGKEGLVGNRLLDEGLGNNPLMTDASKAKVLQQAQNEAGRGVEQSAQGLDQEVQKIIDSGQGEMSRAQAIKQLDELKNQPKASVDSSEVLLPDTKTASAVGSEDASLGFPRQEMELSQKEAPSRFLPVDKVSSGAGPEVDAQIQKLTEIIKQQPNKADKVEQLLNKDNFVKELEAQLTGPIQESGDPNNVIQLYHDYLSKLHDVGGDGTSMMSLNGLNKFKQELRQGISYQGENAGVVAQAKKDFTKTLNDLVLTKAQQVDQLAGTNLADSLLKSNQEYGAFKTGSKAANMNVARESGKSDIGATVLGTAKKFVKNNYHSFAATSLNQLSKLVGSTPQVFGRYAAPLQDAAKRGSTALAATHFALYQNDPKYRETIDPLHASGEQQAKEQSEGEQDQHADLGINK